MAGRYQGRHVFQGGDGEGDLSVEVLWQDNGSHGGALLLVTCNLTDAGFLG